MYTFIADIYILFDICKERYMNAWILWGFVKLFIEINVTKVSRIPNEWGELHIEKIKNQFGRVKLVENLKKMHFLH